MEDLIIKNKLLTDEKLLKRIVKRTLTLLKGDGSESSKQGVFALQAELEHMALNFVKQERSLKLHDREVAYYEDQHRSIEAGTEGCNREIEALQHELAEELRLRRNKDEYDLITKEIFKLSTQSDLQWYCLYLYRILGPFSIIDEVELEMASIASQQNEIQGYIEKGAMATFGAIQTLRQIKKESEMDLKSV